MRAMKNKAKTPCKHHNLAMPSLDISEVVGMVANGVQFTRCKKCGWVIKKPISKKFWKGLKSEIKL